MRAVTDCRRTVIYSLFHMLCMRGELRDMATEEKNTQTILLAVSTSNVRI